MKKLLGVLFAALLIAVVLPVVACADSIDSGTCGENLTWVLDDGGTLTISGTGEMGDYLTTYANGSEITSAPWGAHAANLKTVVIESGVTSIGDYAFHGCSSLTEVSIPAGMTSIGEGAFSSCSSLTEVSIPDSMTSIKGYVFSDCPKLRFAIGSNGAKALSKAGYTFRTPGAIFDLMYLFNNDEILGLEIRKVDKDATSVSIPEGVTSISGSAFSGCSRLTEVSVPDSMTSIKGYVFSDCPKLRFAIGSNGAKALSKAGYSFRASGDNYSLKYLFNNDEISGLEILEVDRAVTSVSIPEGVTSIGIWAFYGCSSLTEVSIPKSVTSICSSAFEDCSSLTEVSIPENVTSIGDCAFEDCSSLTKVNIPEDVTSIGSRAFYNCSSLTEVSIPEGVTSIGEKAFSYCPVCFLASIGSNGAKVLSKAGYTFRTPGANYILMYLFNNDKISDLEIRDVDENATSVNIPEGVTSIGSHAFYRCSSLTEVSIPEGVTSIGYEAFYNCSSLTEVSIPEGVISIGEGAFEYCGKLKKAFFAIQDVDQAISFGSSIFYGSPTTVYCYMFTAPDVWCTKQGITHIYLDEQRAVSLPDDFRMACGNAKRLKCVVFPADSTPITWTSSDPAVVSVDNGKVTALTPGTATITATVGTDSGSVTIETYTAATAIAFSESELWLQAKESISLAVSSYMPEGASADLTWSSSDTKIATVDKAGKVKTFKPGEVTITATTEKGVTESCVLHLTYPVTSLTLAPETTEVSMNDTLQLTATAITKNDSYTNKMVRFTSSDEGVATVNASGLVTAVHHGIATITAETTNGKSATAQITVRCTRHFPVTDVAVASTCTETGLTEGSHCEVCGAILTAQEAVPATGHNWNEPNYVWSADNRTVTATVTCKNGNHPVTETVQTVFEQTKAPTNTAKGEGVYKATFTNVLFKAQTRTVAIPVLEKDDVVKAVEAAIRNAGVNDKAAIEAARAAYDALTPEQKTLVPADVVAKLTAAEQQVKAAEEAAAADQTAAQAAVDAISALSSSAGIADKAAVEAARKAYDALTPEQKALIPADVVAKLTTVEQQVQAAEQKAAEEAAKKAADETAAKSAADAISALSSSAGISDKAAVEAARKAYDALTPEQKALIPADVVAKLATAEQRVQEAEEAAKTTNISACKITVKDLTYTGKKIKKPTVTVKDGKKKLKEGTDYTISYNTKAKAIGAYKLTVTGKGNYSGSKQLTFNINPKGTAFTKVKGGKQLITLKWKNPKNITGYEIQYSLKKDFSGSKTVKIKKAKTLTTTVKKLEAGMTYYVRIRTFTTVKKKNYYSAWSKVKTVKTKGSKKNSIEPVIEASMNVVETLDLRTMLGIPNTDMKWESSDETVATVSEVGVVSALKSGEVVITAIDPDGEQIDVIIRISGENVIELGDVNLLEIGDEIVDEMTMDEETTEIELSME